MSFPYTFSFKFVREACSSVKGGWQWQRLWLIVHSWVSSLNIQRWTCVRYCCRSGVLARLEWTEEGGDVTWRCTELGHKKAKVVLTRWPSKSKLIRVCFVHCIQDGEVTKCTRQYYSGNRVYSCCATKLSYSECSCTYKFRPNLYKLHTVLNAGIHCSCYRLYINSVADLGGRRGAKVPPFSNMGAEFRVNFASARYAQNAYTDINNSKKVWW